MAHKHQQSATTTEQSASYTLDTTLASSSMSFVSSGNAATVSEPATTVTTSASRQGSTGTYDQYFKAFAVRETGGGSFDPTKTPNYQAGSGNSYPALGAYQFDKLSLIATGYYRDDGALSNARWNDTNFTGKNGIYSQKDFLNNPAVQDQAAREWTNTVGWSSITDYGLQSYIGQTVGGIGITAAGLLGGTSLLGPDALKQFLDSGGRNNPTDGYGTPVSDYIAGFAGFQTPFDNVPKTGPVLAAKL